MKKYLCFIFLFILIFSGCQRDEKPHINVYNWGDYIDESVLDDFEKEYGIEVIYETYGNNEELLSKIESGATDYDVLFPSDYMVEIMANKGLLQELNFENIPNYKNIDPRFKGLDYDKKEKYSVPYMWQTIGICYNSEKVDENEMQSWDALWNEKYKNEIIMIDSPRDSIGISLIKDGYSLNSTDDKELEKARDSLIEQKPLVSSYQIDYYKTALVSEECLMSMAWSGDAFLIGEENPKYGYSIPKEGTNLSVDCMVVPKQSDNKEGAELFIDFMNRPDIALRNAEYILYSSPNIEAVKLLPEEVRENQLMYPKGNLDEIGEIFKDLGEYNKVYDLVWTEVKTARK